MTSNEEYDYITLSGRREIRATTGPPAFLSNNGDDEMGYVYTGARLRDRANALYDIPKPNDTGKQRKKVI